MAAMRISLSEWQCPQLAGTHLHYGYLYDYLARLRARYDLRLSDQRHPT